MSRTPSLVTGAGFPTCEQGLSRCEPNYGNDPNGYYRDIGLPTWASDRDVRRQCRQLLLRLHPDTGSNPNVEAFERVRWIQQVLTDPVTRAKYDHTPEGHQYLDRFIVGNMTDSDWKQFEETAQAADKKVFSFYADGPVRADSELAQDWYAELVRVGAHLGYDGRVKLHLGSFYATDDLDVYVRREEPTTRRAIELMLAVRAVA